MGRQRGNRRSMRFAALLLLAALPACGAEKSPPSNDTGYRQSAYTVLDRFTQEQTKFDTGHTTPQKVRRTAERQHDALVHAADGLAALHPPARLRRAQDDAITALRKEAAIFASIEGEVETASSTNELRDRMVVAGDRLARIKDEVDGATQRYLKALG
jgi:hypothetical protein